MGQRRRGVLVKYRYLNGRYARNSIRAPPRPQLPEGSRAAVAQWQTRPAWRWDVARSSRVGRISYPPMS